MDKKLTTAVIIAAIVVIGGIAIASYWPKNNEANQPSQSSSSDQNANTSDGQASQNTTPPDPGSGSSLPEMKNVEVSGNEFSYSPKEIKVKKGEPIRIIYTNTGEFPHDFVIDEFKVKTSTVQPGGKTELTFAPDKTGTFEYYCSLPTHKDKGMFGQLIVE